MSQLFCFPEASADRLACLAVVGPWPFCERSLVLVVCVPVCVSVCAHAPRSNMTYSFGLGEMAKQRVDEAGHVELTDAEARKLLRTKVFCTTAAVVGIGEQQPNPASIRKMTGKVDQSSRLSRTWNIRKPGRKPGRNPI